MVAAANPLRGVKPDSEYVASIVAAIKGPVVLVGHSYGGTIISNAASTNGNVNALVFVAGFAPEAGESAADLAARFPGGTLREKLIPVALPDGGKDLFGDLDKNIPVGAHAFVAKRAGARRTVVVKGASHVVMLSHADAVAECMCSVIQGDVGRIDAGDEIDPGRKLATACPGCETPEDDTRAW